MVVFACNRTQQINEYEESTLDSIQRESIVLDITGLAKFYLPKFRRSKQQIDSIVAQIDQQILNGELIVEVNYGIDDMPCEIVNYGNAHRILKTQEGCGDCSPLMARTNYYYLDDSLVFVKDLVREYDYPPCNSNLDLANYGFDTLKLDEKRRIRTDYIYIGPGNSFEHIREGDSLHDELAYGPLPTAEEWLSQAVEASNYQEPD